MDAHPVLGGALGVCGVGRGTAADVGGHRPRHHRAQLEPHAGAANLGAAFGTRFVQTVALVSHWTGRCLFARLGLVAATASSVDHSNDFGVDHCIGDPALVGQKACK